MDLRIIYAYQRHYTLSREHDQHDDGGALSPLHRFATRFFRQLHAHCPRLRVFVWGLYGESAIPRDLQSGEAFVGTAPVRQHIFVKQTVALPNEHVQISAVPVSASWLRHEYPELDLLRYEPGFKALNTQYDS